MAIRTPTRTDFPGAILWQWTGLLNGDTGAPIEAYEFQNRSVQLNGTFGVGGSVSWEGSNDGAIFNTLNDGAGVALVLTAATLKRVNETTRQQRPNCTAGDGTTSLTVSLWTGRVVR